MRRHIILGLLEFNNIFIRFVFMTVIIQYACTCSKTIFYIPLYSGKDTHLDHVKVLLLNMYIRTFQICYSLYSSVPPVYADFQCSEIVAFCGGYPCFEMIVIITLQLVQFFVLQNVSNLEISILTNYQSNTPSVPMTSDNHSVRIEFFPTRNMSNTLK